MNSNHVNFVSSEDKEYFEEDNVKDMKLESIKLEAKVEADLDKSTRSSSLEYFEEDMKTEF